MSASVKTPIHFRPTDFGFVWGAAAIRRVSARKTGAVMLSLRTHRDDLQIHVTRTGKVRVWNKKGEMRA